MTPKQKAQQRYVETHKEELAAYQASYYQAHKEELRIKRQAYRDANRDKVKQWSRNNYLRRKGVVKSEPGISEEGNNE